VIATIPRSQEKPVSTAPTRTENTVRGALLALLVVPVGIFVYCLIASVGVVASIVSFGVAFGAVWLYQRGAGGFISRAGAWVIAVIIVGTIALSLYVNYVYVVARALAKELPEVFGSTWWVALNTPGFWPFFNEHIGALVQATVVNIVLSVVLGILGSYRTLVRVFRATSGGRVAPYSARSAVPAPALAAAPPPPPAYLSDVDDAPTGSADDKTAPPAAGV
jgi:hypothetical protein